MISSYGRPSGINIGRDDEVLWLAIGVSAARYVSTSSTSLAFIVES
jgi:hypothetical protein